jgi:hypothetical protein
MHWKLYKLISLASYIGRTYICIATSPEFGKSGLFDVLHSLTDRCPVFKPRSVPGVLNHINGTGNMVFDDIIQGTKKEVKDIMEEFCLQVAWGRSVYINGAMKSNNTKSSYNCSNQSITFIYNTLDCYKGGNDIYFDDFFGNNKAIDSRFLKLKMDGMLTEKFDKNFDIIGCAEDNRQYYINVAKYLLHLQEVKQSNSYVLRWKNNSILDVKGRRRAIYNDICWVIDMYSESQQEYDLLITELDKCIIAYKDMVSKPSDKYVNEFQVKEEIIE